MRTAWNSKRLFSSAQQNWRSPSWLVEMFHDRYGFTLDAAAEPSSAVCPIYITEDDDAFVVPWRSFGGRLHDAAWLNPPYGRTVHRWLRRAWEQSQTGVTVVILVFARTDTRAFHDWLWRAADIWFVRGRLRFGRPDGSGPYGYGAPAPSLVAVFQPSASGPPNFHVLRQPTTTSLPDRETAARFAAAGG